jgi:hypothetical protein
MSGDQQELYRRMGYRTAMDGAVEFYYVAFRTHIRTGQKEICLAGKFSWSNHLHDPAVTLQTLPEQDGQYRYSRLGPFPNRAMAEAKAIEMAVQLFKDPTRYGIWGTGGLSQLGNPDYRNPRFF